MTNEYLESTAASRSSIFGSITGAPSLRLGAGCLDDSSDLRRCAVEVVVHHDVIEPARLGPLPRGGLQTSCDPLVVLGSSSPEASLELLHRRRRQEDQDGARNAVPNLLGALHVDLEDHVSARGQLLVHERTGRSRSMIDERRPLEESAALDHVGELVLG